LCSAQQCGSAPALIVRRSVGLQTSANGAAHCRTQLNEAKGRIGTARPSPLASLPHGPVLPADCPSYRLPRPLPHPLAIPQIYLPDSISASIKDSYTEFTPPCYVRCGDGVCAVQYVVLMCSDLSCGSVLRAGRWDPLTPSLPLGHNPGPTPPPQDSDQQQ
jgi:hypothetical protein